MLDAAVFHGGEKLTSGCSKLVNVPALAASNQEVLTELLYRGDDGPWGIQAQAEPWLRLNTELKGLDVKVPIYDVAGGAQEKVVHYRVTTLYSFDGATFSAVLGGQSAAAKRPNPYNDVDSDSMRDLDSLQTVFFADGVAQEILDCQVPGLTQEQKQEFARMTGTGLQTRTVLQGHYLQVYLGPLHLVIRVAAALLAGEVRTLNALNQLPGFLTHLKECLHLEETVIFETRGSGVPRVALTGSNVKSLLQVHKQLLRCPCGHVHVDEQMVAVFDDLWSQFQWLRDTLTTVDPKEFAARAPLFSDRALIFARCGKAATGPAFVTPSVARLVNFVPLGFKALVELGISYGALTEEGIEYLHWVKHLRAQFTGKGARLSFGSNQLLPNYASYCFVDCVWCRRWQAV